jgi:hypothetical protein
MFWWLFDNFYNINRSAIHCRLGQTIWSSGYLGIFSDVKFQRLLNLLPEMVHNDNWGTPRNVISLVFRIQLLINLLEDNTLNFICLGVIFTEVIVIRSFLRHLSEHFSEIFLILILELDLI